MRETYVESLRVIDGDLWACLSDGTRVQLTKLGSARTDSIATDEKQNADTIPAALERYREALKAQRAAHAECGRLEREIARVQATLSRVYEAAHEANCELSIARAGLDGVLVPSPEPTETTSD